MSRVRLLTAAIILAVVMPPDIIAVSGSAAPMTCDVVVLTTDGLPISGLTSSDVEVLSDGIHVPVISFVPASPDVKIIVMVDLSTSQPLRRYEALAGLTNNWLPALLPADAARVGVVGAPPVFSIWFGTDRSIASAVRILLDRALPEPSPIWDSADAAVQALTGLPGTKVVVLMTDGRAGGNVLGVEDLARRAIAADVAIGVISEGGELFLPQKDDAVMRVRTDASLRWLADETGGVYVEDGAARRIASPRIDPIAYAFDQVNKPNQPGPSLVRLMNALRSRYRMTFDAATDGKTHALEVRVGMAGAVVRVKRSYLAR